MISISSFSSTRLIRLFQWYHQKIPLKSPTTSRWFDLISCAYVVWISSRGLLSVVSIILCFFLSLSRFFFISLLIHHWRWSSSSFPFIFLVVFLRFFSPSPSSSMSKWKQKEIYLNDNGIWDDQHSNHCLPGKLLFDLWELLSFEIVVLRRMNEGHRRERERKKANVIDGKFCVGMQKVCVTMRIIDFFFCWEWFRLSPSLCVSLTMLSFLFERRLLFSEAGGEEKRERERERDS